MKTAITVIAGLFIGGLVAVGILAAFVFVGPDPVGLRPTRSPSTVPSPSAAPSPSLAASPSVAPSPSVPASAAPSVGPSSSASGGPIPASGAPNAAFHIGQPAPALVVPQVGGGTIDLAGLRGKAVWLNFMQTTSPDGLTEFQLMNGFAARYGANGLVVIAVDVREAEATVAAFAVKTKATFALGLDTDGAAQRAWGTYGLPIHFWIDKDGIVRDGALGGVSSDTMAAALRKVLPGVEVTQ